MSKLKNFFSKENRDARRAVRASAISSISDALYTRKVAAKLTTQNVGVHALSMVRDVLSAYAIPNQPKLGYSGMRNIRKASASNTIDNGVISIHAEFRTNSGVNVGIDVPVEIREGALIEPSVIVYNGSPRVIAQSTFDTLVSNNTFYHNLNTRDMYSPPSSFDAAVIKVQRVNRGMFSASLEREALSSAISGLPMRSATIKHVDGKWKVYTKDGSKVLGTHGTKAKAQAQLAAVEISKHKKKSADEDKSHPGYVDYNYKNVDLTRNEQECGHLDPAERKCQNDVNPGPATLAMAVDIKDRGGSTHSFSSGTKVQVLRDHAGDNKAFVVRFDNGLEAIVERSILKKKRAQ